MYARNNKLTVVESRFDIPLLKFFCGEILCSLFYFVNLHKPKCILLFFRMD